ncbi:MAG: hypothetical protein ABI398_07675 [Devosia sp.]
MTPLADLTNSFRGWAEIIAGKPTALDNFRISSSGFAVAAATLAIAILLSVAMQSAAAGLPSASQLIFGLLAQAITVALLGLAMRQMLRFLQIKIDLNALLIPTLYALAYVFVLAIPLTLIGPNAALIAMLGLGVLIYRLVRVAAAMKPGLSVAFATVCVIVLVVVPYALYMLLLLLPSA